MKTTLCAVALAAAVSTAAWAGSPTVSAEPGGFQIAQDVDVQVGRDRDRDRARDEHRDRRDLTVGVGPGGVRIGPRDHCRTVTTTVERNGRNITRRERQCD
jgi:hypothetical protein